jgi:hypothetical protein
LLEQVTCLCFHFVLSLFLELDSLHSGLWNTGLDAELITSLSSLFRAVAIFRFIRACGTIGWLWELGNGLLCLF